MHRVSTKEPGVFTVFPAHFFGYLFVVENLKCAVVMLQDWSYHFAGKHRFPPVVKWASVMLCLLLSLGVQAQQGKRTFGPLVIDYTIDSVRNTGLCQFTIDNKVVTTALVGSGGNSTFSINQVGFTSNGMLSIRSNGPQGRQELDINFWYRTGQDSIGYTGALVMWSNSAVIAVDTVVLAPFTLAPLLSIQTKVWGSSRNIAMVTFVNGQMPVYSATLTQVSPMIETTQDIIIGDLVIKKGMTISLSIPSTIINGHIWLNAQFITTDHPLTTFNAQIGSWPL